MGKNGTPVATPARAALANEEPGRPKRKVIKVLVKKQPKKVPKEVPKEVPKDTAYSPPEEPPQPALGGYLDNKDAWDAYAATSAAADAGKLAQDPATLPAAVHTGLDVPKDVPPTEFEANSGTNVSTNEPVLQPAIKDENKSPNDQLVEILVHMGYSFEECQDALVILGSNPTTDAVIEQIHSTREAQHALSLKLQEAPACQHEADDFAKDLETELNTLADPAQNWQPNSWDSYGWWDDWSEEAQNYQYRRSNTWQSTSDVINTPCASQIQSAMDRLNTQDIDGYPLSPADHEQQETPKDDAQTPAADDTKPKDDEVAKPAAKEDSAKKAAVAPVAPSEQGVEATTDESAPEVDENGVPIPYKQTKKYKKAHARYMRYYRSVHESATCPKEIKKMAKRAHNSKTLNGVLFEAYLSCGGEWRKSKLYLSLSETTSEKKLGRRRWMTEKEMLVKFGDATPDIISRKTGDDELREREVRPHPEAPLRKDLVQYLCLDDDLECNSSETQLSYLYQTMDEDSSSDDDASSGSSSSSKKKDKKKKNKGKKGKKSKKDDKKSKKDKSKKKKKKSSSDESSDDQQSEKVADEGETKEKKNKKLKKDKDKKNRKNKRNQEMTEEQIAAKAEKERKRTITSAAKKAIAAGTTKINSWKTYEPFLENVGEKYKEAIVDDVTEKLKAVSEARDGLQRCLNENEVDQCPDLTASLKRVIDDLEKAMGPAKKAKPGPKAAAKSKA